MPETEVVGRHVVVYRAWNGTWQVQDQSWNPPRDVDAPHPTRDLARAAAARLNSPGRRHTTTPTAAPAPPQPTLFDTQEVTG